MNAESKNSTLFLVLAVVISIGIGFFVFQPAVVRYREHLTELAAREEEEVQLTEMKTKLTKLQKEIDAHAAEAELLALAVPTDSQIPELVSQMSGLADASVVRLLTIQPARSKANTDLTVTLTVEGAFPDILGLAERLEKNLRPAQVQTINIVQAAGESNQLTATLKVMFAQAVVTEGGL